MGSFRSKAVLLGLALVVAGGPALTPAGAVSGSSSTGFLNDVSARTFSPNGDGVKDRGRVTFKVTRSVKVTVRVVGRPDGDLIKGPVRLGKLSRGEHAFMWDGRRNGGGIVEDGEYDVRVVAKRRNSNGLAVSREQTSISVDTVLESDDLQTNRDVVYPRSTEVRDRISFQVGRVDVRTARLTLRNSRGKVVRRKSMRVEQRPDQPFEKWEVLRADWFARSGSGHALPAGRYVARVLVKDAAGNHRVLKRKVEVSLLKATRQVWTQTVNAAAAPQYLPPCDALGCGDFPPCLPVASERFIDGLSFRSSAACDPVYLLASRSFGMPVPVVPSPDDEYRITATGGPTEVGAPDEGNLDGTVVSGEGSTSTNWRRVDLTADAWIDQNVAPWSFSTRNGAAYDVGTFTVEYAYYAPAS